MKIGIIGSGAAGLMAAWLLEQDHDVVLFEGKQDLGGHIDTLYVTIQDEIIPIETGFEFFSAPLFPVFCKLLNKLNVQIAHYPLTYTFSDASGNVYVLPPFAQNRISWKSLAPQPLWVLMQFKYFLLRGAQFIKKQNVRITLQEFAQKIGLSEQFNNSFYIPSTLVHGELLLTMQRNLLFTIFLHGQLKINLLVFLQLNGLKLLVVQLAISMRFLNSCM